MALFDGVQNFTPAFTGQQIASQVGQGAGQSISRGSQVGQRGHLQRFRETQLDKEVNQSNQMGEEMQNQIRQQRELDSFMGELDGYLRLK